MSFQWEWQELCHYTSRANRESILFSGVIRQGVDELVYMSPNLFNSNVDAIQALSIPNSPVECALKIKTSSLPDPVQERSVVRLFDLFTGEVTHIGGGTQIIFLGDVPLPLSIFDL